jgi:hypothetical protein
MTTKPRNLTEFVRLVLDAIEATEIEYLIGGAVALWAWGEIRTTQDLDVVVNLPGTRIVHFSEELKRRDMLVPPDIIVDLLIQPEGDLPINAIHLYSGYKAELFLLRPGDEYRALALQRRRYVNLGQSLGNVYVHSPEDLILNKVHYFGLSQQTKHIRDIAAIMVMMGEQLDWTYMEDWAARLQISSVLEEVRRQVDALRKRESKS